MRSGGEGGGSTACGDPEGEAEGWEAEDEAEAQDEEREAMAVVGGADGSLRDR